VYWARHINANHLLPLQKLNNIFTLSLMLPFLLFFVCSYKSAQWIQPFHGGH
jgi:hypothetical protein